MPSPTICDRCGGPLTDGYLIRDYGTDPHTGYHDEQVLCVECLDEEAKELARARGYDPNDDHLK